MARQRKARSDRNHAIYLITNTVTNEQYIGITVIVGNIKKAIRVRCQKHAERARNENKNWGLCNALREHGAENFTYGLLQVVRGKKNAHAVELELIRSINPALNTFK